MELVRKNIQCMEIKVASSVPTASKVSNGIYADVKHLGFMDIHSVQVTAVLYVVFLLLIDKVRLKYSKVSLLFTTWLKK